LDESRFCCRRFYINIYFILKKIYLYNYIILHIQIGIGGPHPGGAEGRIWSMSIIMQALTSNDDDEITQCLNWIKASSGNTGVLRNKYIIFI
jgi:meiotically up-regulated gene 157 (Mug157) protein